MSSKPLGHTTQRKSYTQIVGGVPMQVYEDEDLSEIEDVLREKIIPDPTALINPDPKKEYKWCDQNPEAGYTVDRDANVRHVLNPQRTDEVTRWNELILCSKDKRKADIVRRFKNAKAQHTAMSSMIPLIQTAAQSARRDSSGKIVQDVYPTLSKNGRTFDYNDLSEQVRAVDPVLLTRPDFSDEQVQEGGD